MEYKEKNLKGFKSWEYQLYLRNGAVPSIQLKITKQDEISVEKAASTPTSAKPKILLTNNTLFR